MEHTLKSPASPACMEAVSAFAFRMRMDAEALLAGARFEYKDTHWRLEHYGALDPDAITLVLEIGDFAAGHEDLVCRRLLEHHIMFPSGRYGFYALAPKSNTVLYCTRIPVTQDNAHEVIATNIETMASSIAASVHEMTQVIEEVMSTADTANTDAAQVGGHHAHI